MTGIVPPTSSALSSSSSSSFARPLSLSQRSLARLLVVLTVATVVFNVVFLSPLHDLPVRENPYFFSPQNHHGLHRRPPGAAFDSAAAGGLPRRGNATLAGLVAVSSPSSEEEGRRYMLSVFREAGVVLTDEMRAELPSWGQVLDVVGDAGPRILGLQKEGGGACQAYRDAVPPLERMLGASGMFNTGTNLVTHLLKQNCEIPERREKAGPRQSKESYGMRWQVPWGKHTPAKFRLDHATKKATDINKDYILPIVTIRHPYSWFKSMCKNGYTAKWDHGKIHDCPNLKTTTARGHDEWNPLTVKFADGRHDEHQSLAHLWNDWYSYYVDQADFPYLVVRMEDLVFFPKETTRLICECAGGKIRTDQDHFQFVVDSAKADSPGHDKSTGIFAAWVKYSARPEPRFGFSEQDYEAAREALNGELMASLGYKHPPAE